MSLSDLPGPVLFTFSLYLAVGSDSRTIHTGRGTTPRVTSVLTTPLHTQKLETLLCFDKRASSKRLARPIYLGSKTASSLAKLS